MTQRPTPWEPQDMNSEESAGVEEQVRTVQGKVDGPRAVISGRAERGVTAAEDVRQPDDLVTRPDDRLD